jgi:hypothetical protein
MRLHALYAIPLVLGMLAVAGCDNSRLGGQTNRSKAAAASAVPVIKTASSGEDAAPASGPQTDKFRDYVAPKREPREMTLVSIPVADAPIVDGQANEAFWQTAPAITTLDYSSQRPITIRSVHTKREIFFLATFPEEIPHETHKTWVWDAKEEVYREGPDREDVFVFKWSMSGNAVDLRLREAQPHVADIWFWKAHRTNPSGYADDKGQGVSKTPGATARKIQSAKHGTLYFDRWGDKGEPAWQAQLYFDYQGPRLPQFVPRTPEGSRADVRAKGVWSNKQWTLEFGRKLNTGHHDDIVFTPGGLHLFAVACYAMALDTPHESWSRPLYRTGDAFDRLLLSVAPGAVAQGNGR